MTNQDKNIKRMSVVIAGRSYPVKVTEEEALEIPNIEKKINDQIMEIQMSYKNLDTQDCVSMVLLTNTMSNINAAQPDNKGLADKIDSINSTLKSALS